MSILGRLPVEIAENCEEFVVSTKRKFLYFVHEEMELWQEAGIPPAEILRSATLVPAKFVGLDSRLGTIKEGKAASPVLVRANPLKDIRNANKIESVFLRGRYFNRNDLDQLLKETKDLCKR